MNTRDFHSQNLTCLPFILPSFLLSLFYFLIFGYVFYSYIFFPYLSSPSLLPPFFEEPFAFCIIYTRFLELGKAEVNKFPA